MYNETQGHSEYGESVAKRVSRLITQQKQDSITVYMTERGENVSLAFAVEVVIIILFFLKNVGDQMSL